MSLGCPGCATDGALRVVRYMSLPPDARSDEIAISVLVCDACGFDAASSLEASRRGAPDAELVDRRLAKLPDDDLDRLDDAIASCPSPLDERCLCAAHRRLGATAAGERWIGLERGIAALALAESPPSDDESGDVADPPPPDSPLGRLTHRSIGFDATGNVDRPLVAMLDGRRIVLRLGDFPEDPLYAVEVDGVELGALDDWPDAWSRPGR